ncbi:MAG: hypothetical protein PQJ50_10045 [Spirochaetales bacterium]|nr:hypothetical protein [Spirochaetales bacterium]
MNDIYYLRWKDRSLYLCELEGENFLGPLEREDLRVLCGTQPEEEDINSVKNQMKLSIEKAVNSWINDSKFLLHILMAAGVFLVSFYFLSYVVRDPLPLVDEIILSALLGGLAFYRLTNQQYQSEKAIQRKLEMEQYLTSLSVEKSPFLEQVELYLEKLADMDEGEVKKIIDSGAVPAFFTSDRKDMLKLIKAAEQYKKKTRFKKGKSLPPEMSGLIRQFRAFMRYHSSMV